MSQPSGLISQNQLEDIGLATVLVSVGLWELWPWDDQVLGLPRVHLELWDLFFLLVRCSSPDPAPQTAYIGIMPTTLAASGLEGPEGARSPQG